MAMDTMKVLCEDNSLVEGYEDIMSEQDVLTCYEAMVLSRRLDERLVALQRQGRIGFHIGAVGEEASIIGSAFAMRKSDYIFPAYREFGAALLRGMPLQRYMDNMFGNANDVAKGRQMPDHYSYAEAHFGSVSSPIGTQITHAVGFAMGAKIQGEDVVTLSYFGEGSTSSNEFHNGMNFAGVFHVPTIMFCRNNQWAISVPAEKQTASESFAEKGIAYGVHSVRCDGNDLFAVVAATKEAVDRAASGRGPTLIEAVTYRLEGHSTSDDPRIYRSAEAVEPWQRRDPIERLRGYLVSHGLWDDQRERALIDEILERISNAIDVAEAAAAPSLESMMEDVYEVMPAHLVEQQEQLLGGPRHRGGH